MAGRSGDMESPETGRIRPREAGHQGAGQDSDSALSSPESPDLITDPERGINPTRINPTDPVENFSTPVGKTPAGQGNREGGEAPLEGGLAGVSEGTAGAGGAQDRLPARA